MNAYTHFSNLETSMLEGEHNSQIKHLTRKAKETVNTPIYAAIAAQEQGILAGQTAHALVMDEARNILARDEHQETGREEYLQLSKAFRQRLRRKLTHEQEEELTALEDKLFIYWPVEQAIRKDMEREKTASKHVIQHLTKLKSSDVKAYFKLLSFTTQGRVPKEIFTELYLQQIQRDFADDIQDLFEDHSWGNPNPILLRMMPVYNPGTVYGMDELEQIARDTGALEAQEKFITRYVDRKMPELPREYDWLRN